MRGWVLDLFCGGGGAAMGYYRAGFQVVGVDNQPQPRYPFKFIHGDALEYAQYAGYKYDFIHASPPCQRYSTITKCANSGENYPDLIPITRQTLEGIGKPYAIENVIGAPLLSPVMLCGTMFELMVIRHRLFETFPRIHFAPRACRHLLPVVKHGRRPIRGEQYHGVTGHFSDVEYARIAMGIDWLGQKELAQAIPPAYTEWVINTIYDILGGNNG